MGESYHLPPCCLIERIDLSRINPDGRKISTHKTNMGFTACKSSEDLYQAWRIFVQDQMTAWNFVLPNDKPANYPDTDFLPMYTGMRAWLPACYLIATTGAVNNRA